MKKAERKFSGFNFRLTICPPGQPPGQPEGGWELLIVKPYGVEYGSTTIPSTRRLIRIDPGNPKPKQLTIEAGFGPELKEVKAILSPGSQLSFSDIVDPEAGEIVPEGQEFRGLKFDGSCDITIENISGKNR